MLQPARLVVGGCCLITLEGVKLQVTGDSSTLLVFPTKRSFLRNKQYGHSSTQLLFLFQPRYTVRQSSQNSDNVHVFVLLC